MHPVHLLVEEWKQQDVKLLPPKSEQQVRQAFSDVARPVSDDIVELYCITGGMLRYYQDDQLIELWSFERVIEELRESNAAADMEFADVLMDSHRFAFRVISPTCASVRMHMLTGDVGDDFQRFESSVSFFERWLDATRNGDEFWGLPNNGDCLISRS